MGVKEVTTVDLANSLVRQVKAYGDPNSDEAGNQRARALALVVALGAVIAEYDLPIAGVIDVLRSVTHLQQRTLARNKNSRATLAQRGGKRGR